MGGAIRLSLIFFVSFFDQAKKESTLLCTVIEFPKVVRNKMRQHPIRSLTNAIGYS
jgi:hypothetical protein